MEVIYLWVAFAMGAATHALIVWSQRKTIIKLRKQRDSLLVLFRDYIKWRG